MTERISKRVTTELVGDFVVFRIEMQVHRLWKGYKSFPVFRGSPKMLNKLESELNSGLVAYDSKIEIRTHEFVQYWQSFESLREYALDPGARHALAMKWTNSITKERNAVWSWHEMSVLCGDRSETVYHNMPATGLQKAGTLHSATGLCKNATGRLEQTGNQGGIASVVQ